MALSHRHRVVGRGVWGGGWGTVPGLFVLGLGNGLALNRAGSLTLSELSSNRQPEASAINSGAGDIAYAVWASPS